VLRLRRGGGRFIRDERVSLWAAQFGLGWSLARLGKGLWDGFDGWERLMNGTYNDVWDGMAQREGFGRRILSCARPVNTRSSIWTTAAVVSTFIIN
jgi:hypothetical protein